MTTIPATMPAAVFMGLRDVAVEERPAPDAGPGDLLLEVSHCGICGSDLHFLARVGRPHGCRSRATSTRARSPRSATDVTGWAVGDRGRSAARRPSAARASTASRGRPSLCVDRGRVGTGDGDWQGAFAGYKTVHAAEALRVPDGLSLKHAALTEPLAVALHGITRAAVPGRARAGS